MGSQVASAVLQHLNPNEVKRISRAFMAVSEVDRETQLRVASEFRDLLKAGDTLLIDGRDFARSVITSAFGEAAGDGLLEAVNGASKEKIAAIFQGIPDKILNAFVTSEHPQTSAFLMTRMNPEQAASILRTMTEEAQTEALLRISHLNTVKGDVVDEVREVIRTQLKGISMEAGEDLDGPKIVANILNYVERTNEERILTEIEETNPELAEQIRNLMFTFEDIKEVDDRGVQTILKDVPRDQLVVSLKTASQELKDLILRNVSQRAAAMILEDLGAMGPVKIKDVEKAQQGIVDIVRRLEAEGKIALGGGSEEAFI